MKTFFFAWLVAPAALAFGVVPSPVPTSAVTVVPTAAFTPAATPAPAPAATPTVTPNLTAFNGTWESNPTVWCSRPVNMGGLTASGQASGGTGSCKITYTAGMGMPGTFVVECAWVCNIPNVGNQKWSSKDSLTVNGGALFKNGQPVGLMDGTTFSYTLSRPGTGSSRTNSGTLNADGTLDYRETSRFSFVDPNTGVMRLDLRTLGYPVVANVPAQYGQFDPMAAPTPLKKK